jgi:hypothetical protein
MERCSQYGEFIGALSLDGLRDRTVLKYGGPKWLGEQLRPTPDLSLSINLNIYDYIKLGVVSCVEQGMV